MTRYPFQGMVYIKNEGESKLDHVPSVTNILIFKRKSRPERDGLILGSPANRAAELARRMRLRTPQLEARPAGGVLNVQDFVNRSV